MGWWRQRSLRARVMLLASVAVAVGLAVGGAVLVAVLGASLQRSVDAEATRTGQDVARLVAEEALPEPLPVAGVELVQVVDPGGRVLAASIGADRLVPVLRDTELAELRGGGKRFVDGDRIGATGPVRVVAVTAQDDLVVLVSTPVGDLRRSVEVLRVVLLVAFPLLVLALATTMWRVVGATLRPVEALRAGAEEITAAGRPATLPEPVARDEIHRLAVTLNDMLARLDGARARQRAFVADAAHELRSPLANLQTQLEVSRRLGKDADWPEVTEDLLADVGRLSRLVDDLLLLARADDPAAPEPGDEPVELRALLHAVARPRPQARVAASGGPADSADGEPPSGPVPAWTRGDPPELRRVLDNLVDNAVRHARGTVVLDVRRDGPDHLVTVTDDGPGIPPADRERVFDRFTRLDLARGRDAGGAGLGLAIVRELVRRHGGSVRLDDADAEAGQGLRVEVRLPAVDSDDPAPRMRASPAGPPVPQPARRRR